MTRKDYVALVGALRRAHKTASDLHGLVGRCAVDEAAREIAAVLAADNPRFDRDRFAEAYGGEAVR